MNLAFKEQKPIDFVGTTVSANLTGLKDDFEKPPLGLIPRSALLEEAAVMGYGLEKYTRNNWRKGLEWSRVIDASMRHLLAFNEGEDLDPESGLHHLAHVRACCSFLIEYMLTHPELDDRYRGR
jgi:hypothetical protein